MKKMIKLSLAAAVAVSALSTTASAGSLEDAIKDTTISGKAMIGYNFTKDKVAENTTNSNEYDFDITLTTKVNDTISFTTGIQADHDIDVSDESTDADKADKITLTKLYFTAKTDVATVMVGKQKQPTPFLDDERGDGVVALIPAGPVTVAAGHFTGMNGGHSVLNLSERDITAAAVIGAAGPVNVAAWYVTAASADSTLATLEAGLDAYSLNLSGKFGPVNVELNHASAELANEGGSNWDNETLTKLVVSGAAAGVNFVAGYGFTNDNANNARNHGVDLTDDDDAKTNFRLDQIVLDDYNDADAILLGASMTFGATTVGANYLMATAKVDAANDIDATELDINVKYAMSKNFSITGLYSSAEADQGAGNIIDEDRMELSLNYKF